MTSNPAVSRMIYASLVVMNLIIGALLIEIGRGTVPIPPNLQWTVPILVAALNGIALFLPRIGGERLARQVDRLAESGVPKHRMRVVDREQMPL